MTEVLKTVQSYLNRWFRDPNKIYSDEFGETVPGWRPDRVPPLKSPEDRKNFNNNADWESIEEYKEKIKGVPTTIDEMAIAEFKGLQGYRANPKNKWGAKDGLETQPISFGIDDISSLLNNTRAMRQEKSSGIPQLSPQEIAAFALKEGRGDGHNNGSDVTNPALFALFSKLREKYGEDTASYLTTLKEKQDIANRLGISLAEAWNGTGVNYNGSSGADYAKGYKNFLTAANHPKNKALLDFITNASNTAGKK